MIKGHIVAHGTRLITSVQSMLPRKRKFDQEKRDSTEISPKNHDFLIIVEQVQQHHLSAYRSPGKDSIEFNVTSTSLPLHTFMM